MPRSLVVVLGLAVLLPANGLGQVEGIYDGSVSEPDISSSYDSSTDTTALYATTESWDGGPAGNVRLEAGFTFKGRKEVCASGPLLINLIRVGTDPAWSSRSTFALIADGKPLPLRQMRRKERYQRIGVKIGVEETLTAGVSARTLSVFAHAKRAEVRIRGESNRLSAASQQKLVELLERMRGTRP